MFSRDRSLFNLECIRSFVTLFVYNWVAVSSSCQVLRIIHSSSWIIHSSSCQVFQVVHSSSWIIHSFFWIIHSSSWIVHSFSSLSLETELQWNHADRETSVSFAHHACQMFDSVSWDFNQHIQTTNSLLMMKFERYLELDVSAWQESAKTYNSFVILSDHVSVIVNAVNAAECWWEDVSQEVATLESWQLSLSHVINLSHNNTSLTIKLAIFFNVSASTISSMTQISNSTSINVVFLCR